MERIVCCLVVLGIWAFVSCGGGGGSSSPTPTPTSDGTKGIAVASSDEAGQAALAGAQDGILHLAFTSVSSPLNLKESVSGTIDTTYSCEEGGSVAISGSGGGDCTAMGDNWTCSALTFNMTLTFNGCVGKVTIGGTEYTETLNGTSGASVSGSASGTSEGYTSYSSSGSFSSSNITVTGTAEGTADLDHLTFTVSWAGSGDPAITCSGTAGVTIDSTEEVCSISTDCSTCTE